MTAQEIFDTVAEHLLNQNAKAVDECGVPMYYAPDGKKCAIGCLIPQELYKEEMEGLGASNVFDAFRMNDIVSGECYNLVDYLQYVHDELDVEKWRASLVTVAEYYNFSLDKLQ